MKTYAFCPITDKKINENSARSNAGITVLLITLYGLTGNAIFMIFLASDFLLRSTGLGKISPIAFASKNIVKYLSLKTHLINAGPKLFAARIGTLLTALAVLLLVFSLQTASLFVAGVLLVFSFLEVAFGVCVACLIYPYVYKLLYKIPYKQVQGRKLYKTM